jgi:putative membrane protein
MTDEATSAAPPTPLPSPNRTRDHLANERTFLAWVRTGLGLIGLGFVLARMGLFLRQLALVGGVPNLRGLHPGREFLVTGVVFLALGTVLSGWTGWLYHRTRRAIDDDCYQPAMVTVTALTVVVVVGGILIAGLVLRRTLGD